MPSTYSQSLKLQLIGTGEQAGTWGTTTNYNLGTLLEQAITGVVTIPMGDATYTLTNYNGLSDEARNAVLVLNGPITTPQALIMPPQQKVYIVRNRTGNTVTLTANVGATTINIANAASEVIFCDGSNVYSATQFNYIEGDLTVTGNVSVGKNLVVLKDAAFGANIVANSSTGQIYLPTGNTASRAANGTAGIFRYNNELAIYEGYTGGTWVRFQTYPQGVYTINYLIVAGGGAGGFINSFGGGGGGGGHLASSLSVTPGATYTMVVGGGGSGANRPGTNSSITGVDSATGGGYGGQAGSYIGGGNGGSGGSGGGGGSFAGGESGSGGAGITGQGFAGGTGSTFVGGGGGGGGAVGGNGGGDAAGVGGAGYLSTITGSAVYYSGGGGGGGGGGSGTGGIGGGGSSGNNGQTNTGGGAGAGTTNGGSGIVILQIPTVSYSNVTTGSPTVSVSGANTILKYTSSGTYTA